MKEIMLWFLELIEVNEKQQIKFSDEVLIIEIIDFYLKIYNFFIFPFLSHNYSYRLFEKRFATENYTIIKTIKVIE